MADPSYRPNARQQQALDAPPGVDILLAGGRGFGKTEALCLLILQHCQLYGEQARVLVFRTTYPVLKPIYERLLVLSAKLGHKIVSANAQDLAAKYTSGATVRFISFDGNERDWSDRVVGESASMIAWDEVGVLANPSATVDKTRSLLRGSVPTRMVMAANAGRVANAWLRRRYVDEAERAGYGAVFTAPETNRPSVVIRGIYSDNPTLGPEYESNLRASARGDAALLSAWLDGSMTVVLDGMFAANMDPRVTVDWPLLQKVSWADYPIALECFVDHGSQAPFAAVLIARFTNDGAGPDGRRYAHKTRVVVAEASSVHSDLSGHDTAVVADVAASLLNLQDRAQTRFPIFVDAAVFADHGIASVAAEYERYLAQKVHPAAKGPRAQGWQLINSLLAAATAAEPIPALHLTRWCPYLTAALNNAARSPTDPEDVDAKGSARMWTHPLDALGYGLKTKPRSNYIANLPVHHYEDGRPVKVISEDMFGHRDIWAVLREKQELERKLKTACSVQGFVAGRNFSWETVRR